MGGVFQGQPEQMFPVWDFVVEIDGINTTAGFTEASGLEIDMKVAIFKQAGDPGIASVSNTTNEPKPVTFKRGSSSSGWFWSWASNVLENGVQDNRNISVVHQFGGIPKIRYNITQAAITNFKAPAFDRSKEEETAIEEMTVQPTNLSIQYL